MTEKTRGSDLLSRVEAADYVGRAPKTLANWAYDEYPPLPYHHIGGKAFYFRRDLDQLLVDHPPKGGR